MSMPPAFGTMSYLVRDEANPGQPYGPASMAELVQWALELRLTPESLIAPAGTQNWQHADTYTDLHATFISADYTLRVALAGLGSAGVASPPSGFSSPGAMPHYPPTPATNGTAVASLVLSLIGLLVCPIIFSVIGIILGFVAKSSISASHGREGGDGMATAGIVLGFIGIPLGCIAAAYMSSIGHHRF